jgi:hypothetical protein
MERSYHPDSALIDALGGSVQVSLLCRVTSQAVSQWRRTGIPEARRMYLQAVRPEVFTQAEPAPCVAAGC